MVHGQIRRLELLTAMIAKTFAQFLLPPLALAKFSSLGFFSLLMLRAGRLKEDVHEEQSIPVLER